MWIFCFDAKIFIAEATRKKVRSSFKMQFLCISIPSSSLVGNMMVGGGIARCLKIIKKSHSKLQAKRAAFAKVTLKMPKMVHSKIQMRHFE